MKYNGGWLNLLFHQATVTELSAQDGNVLKCLLTALNPQKFIFV